MTAIQFNYPQWRLWQAVAPRRTVFAGLGRGVGKSWFFRTAWWLLIAEWEHKLRTKALKPFTGVRIIPLMPTLTQFKDVHMSGIEQDLAGDFAFLGGRIDRQRGQVTFPGGSWLKPFPASTYNARTARGMRGDVLCSDECDDIDCEVYDAVAVPWLSEPWSLGIELLGGTPTRGRHGLWYRTLAAGRKGQALRDGATDSDLTEKASKALQSIYSFHATYADAPETVSDDAVEKARATTLPATFRREWEADPDAGEGLVYPFEEDFHVRERPALSSFSEFIVGADHGWVDAGVMLLCGIQGHGNDAVMWVLDEWYESECPNHVWDQRAVAWKFAKFWPDPSRPDRINTLRSLGLDVGETDNNIDGGISRVADLLFRRKREDAPDWARLFVAPECKNTIKEFGLYRRKKLSDGTFDEQPEDKWNHAMDSLRYACVGRFGRGSNYRTAVSGS